MKRLDSYLTFSKDLAGYLRIMALLEHLLQVESTHDLVGALHRQNQKAALHFANRAHPEVDGVAAGVGEVGGAEVAAGPVVKVADGFSPKKK